MARAPEPPKSNEACARKVGEDVDVVLVFLLRFALSRFASFFRGRCDLFPFLFFYIYFLKGHCFHFFSKKSSGLQILFKNAGVQQSSRDQTGIWRPFEVNLGIR